VCPTGACAYSSVTAALLAARGGDVVHVQKGNYANQATTNVALTSDITLRHHHAAPQNRSRKHH
jgi:hypothetical protein